MPLFIDIHDHVLEVPTKEAAIRVHRESHGLVAGRIFEVVEGA